MQRIPVKPVPELVRRAAANGMGPGSPRRGGGRSRDGRPAVVLLDGFLITPFAWRSSWRSPTSAWCRRTRRASSVPQLRPAAHGASLRDDAAHRPRHGRHAPRRRRRPRLPVLRDITRRNPDYPQFDGLRELASWQLGERRLYLLASDVVFMRAVGNTLLFVLVVAPTQATLALLLALMINQRLRGVNVFRTIYFMPVVISIVVVSLLWRFIYSPGGLLNSMLTGLTFGGFTPDRLAREPEHRARRHHGHVDLAGRGLPHGDLALRPADHPRRPVRGGLGRGRQHAAEVPARHLAGPAQHRRCSSWS
jgi:hypothetical protein